MRRGKGSLARRAAAAVGRGGGGRGWIWARWPRLELRRRPRREVAGAATTGGGGRGAETG